MLSLEENALYGKNRFILMFDNNIVDRFFSSDKIYKFVDCGVMIHFLSGIKMDVNDFLGETICKMVREGLNYK